MSVTDGTGREARGTIAALSSSSLELSVAGNRRSFLESETRTIRQRRSDPLKNGALWGLGIGVGYALLVIVSMEMGSEGGAVVGTFVMGGIGTAAGIGVDAIVRSNEVIYSRPARTSTRLTLSPLLVRDRKGALLSLGF